MQTSRLLPMKGLSNTRDLGGILTKDGHSIREGMLYRSGQLYFGKDTDIEQLQQLNIRKIFDFRSRKEREDKPDPKLSGEVNLHLPIVQDIAVGITRDEDSDKDAFTQIMEHVVADPSFGTRQMMETYLLMVKEPYALSQYGTFLREIAETKEGAVLWHCTAGKDRAGFGTALVLELLDVPRETIREDYLATNTYLQGEIQFIIEMLSRQMDLTGSEEIVRSYFGAKEEYLEQLYSYIDGNYGGMQCFLREQLGITEHMQQEMKERYLI